MHAVPQMSCRHPCWICWPCLHLDWLCWPCQQFLQCLADTSAGNASHACHYPNVWQTPCWICWPCLQFTQCLADTPAGYVYHASNSSNVWQTHLLDMLAMPTIHLMSGTHPCWICWPCLQFTQCLADTSAGYVGHANNSSNVWQTHLLDMLAMLTIPPMSGKHLGWICWPCLQFLECLWDIPAGCAGHAHNSLNVFGTSLLDMLAMLTIP